MNRQLSALPDSKTTRIILPYNRQYVFFAVYEVLDKNGAEYEKTDASTILAEMSVYGNLSRFSVSVNEQETGTELTVPATRQAHFHHYLENELVINKLKA